MKFFSLLLEQKKYPTLLLHRDLIKHIKRGHRWIYADATKASKDVKSSIPTGIVGVQYKNEFLGWGVYQSDSPLSLRMLCLTEEVPSKKIDSSLTNVNLQNHMHVQWQKALQVRKSVDTSHTNAFRLINGEGDGFPGLVIDLYATTAVIKFDDPIFEEKIWCKKGLASQLQSDFPFLTCIYVKRKNDQAEVGQLLYGDLAEEVEFRENNICFSANIKAGSKTGFFLDQRDNRNLIKQFSKNKTVLNLFSYTGGFSVYAGLGGAKSVTSVDIAKPAIQALQKNFILNQLKTPTTNIAEDAFSYLTQAHSQKLKFDLVITDPPSFAPNSKSVPQAIAAYTKIFSDSLRLVQPNGLFAASSCSSHISHSQFIELLKESFSKARLRGTLLQMGHQPFDHPYPLAMDELRYLKFALFRIDS